VLVQVLEPELTGFFQLITPQNSDGNGNILRIFLATPGAHRNALELSPVRVRVGFGQPRERRLRLHCLGSAR
jgi:hypothetical protein